MIHLTAIRHVHHVPNLLSRGLDAAIAMKKETGLEGAQGDGALLAVVRVMV